MLGFSHPDETGLRDRVGDAVFSPVRAGNAFEDTVERLLGLIRLGRIARGERLPPQRELAQRLHVSRVTLREALRALEVAGYVETHRGRRGGTVVTYEPVRRAPSELPSHPSPETASALSDALAFRLAVEPAAAALAATRSPSPAVAAQLRRYLRESSGAPLAGYRQADSRLHLAIAELSGSPSLVAAIAEVRLRVNDLLDAMPLLPHNLDHSSRQHEQIVRAVLSGDAAQARSAMDEHLAATGALLRGFLG